jgi:hypothetical protein
VADGKGLLITLITEYREDLYIEGVGTELNRFHSSILPGTHVIYLKNRLIKGLSIRGYLTDMGLIMRILAGKSKALNHRSVSLSYIYMSANSL